MRHMAYCNYCNKSYWRNTVSLPLLLLLTGRCLFCIAIFTTVVFRVCCVYFCVPSNSASLLGFLVELLKSSVAMQEQMLGGKGFLVIGYLLEKVDAYDSQFKNFQLK